MSAKTKTAKAAAKAAKAETVKAAAQAAAYNHSLNKMIVILSS